MPEKKNFIKFIEQITESRDFNLFVTLGYAPQRLAARQEWEKVLAEVDPSGHGRRWHSVGLTSGESPIAQLILQLGLDEYLCLEERRNPSIFSKRPELVLYHLLAEHHGYDDETETYWKYLTGGWTRQRSLENAKWLLGHFVMRLGCELDLNCYPFCGRYTQSDFRSWREK
jgi:hypothetical protein